MFYSKLVNGFPVGKFDQDFVNENSEINFIPFYEGNFIKPFWNGQSYEESATAQEIKHFQEKCFDIINEYFVKLHISALSKVTGKKAISFDYLRLQKQEYDFKYQTAIEILNDQTVSLLWMQTQMNLEKDFEDFAGENLLNALSQLGLSSLDDRLKDFCQIVKIKYEFAEPLLNDFIGKITFMRTRLVTDVELLNFNNFNLRIEIVEYVLNNNLTPVEIDDLFIDFTNVGNE